MELEAIPSKANRVTTGTGTSGRGRLITCNNNAVNRQLKEQIAEEFSATRSCLLIDQIRSTSEELDHTKGS
jgi:hypothetical protein